MKSDRFGTIPSAGGPTRGLSLARSNGDSFDDRALATALRRAELRVASTERQDRLDRFSRMSGVLRVVEAELTTLMPEDFVSSDAHRLRVARAHALALIDLLEEVRVRDASVELAASGE